MLRRSWPHRVTLQTGALPVRTRRGVTAFHYQTGDPTGDFLLTHGNRRENLWLERPLFALGRFVPRLPLGLVVGGRRR